MFPYDEIIAQFAKCIQKDDNDNTVRMGILDDFAGQRNVILERMPGTVEDPLAVRADGLELDEADLRIVAPPYKSIEADSLTFEQGDTVLLLTPDGQTYYIAGKVRDGHV